MRRLTGIFGGGNPTPLGGGFSAGSWETNTLVSEKTTVMCLDDYHLNDRAVCPRSDLVCIGDFSLLEPACHCPVTMQGRKVTGLTALDERENNFDLMFEQMSALRRGEKVWSSW